MLILKSVGGATPEADMSKLITLKPAAQNAAKHAHGLHALHWLGQWGALGIFAVAVLDFSIIPLPLPNVTDLLLLWLVSHGGTPWVLVPSAVAGGIVGAYTTWHVGWKGGRSVLQRYRSLFLLEPVLRWMERYPIPCALLLPLMPPPVPLASLVLVSGATGTPRRSFFPAFTMGLGLRYLLIAWLGEIYGHHIVRMWAWALRKWSGPMLWTGVALLLGFGILGVWRTYLRSRCSRSKTEAVQATASASN